MLIEKEGNYSYLNGKGDGHHTDLDNMFIENRLLFMPATLARSTILRGMDTDFGILPYPIFDEVQEDYCTITMDGSSISAIPSAVKDPEMCGMILGALSAESKQTVIPVYYDNVLKGKTTRDVESEGMIDILRETIVYDFGYIHSASLGDIFSAFDVALTRNKAPNFTSWFAKNERYYAAGLKKLLKAYDKLA